jgi:two-component system LytT family sensor kinase
MHKLTKYLFPTAYGLLVYFTIRLLQDSESGIRFWRRDWKQNLLEITISVAFSYFAIYLYRKMFVYFGRAGSAMLDKRRFGKEFTAFLLLNYVLVNLVFTPMAAFTDDGLSLADFVVINTIPILYAVIYYGIARSNTYYAAFIEHKFRLEKMTNDHLESELKFLKAQYHPHFLFNALNTIYFQMDKDVSAAKKSVEKLSELLRYQLYDQQQKVAVKQEVQYLKNFIELQKVRSSSKLKVNLHFDEKLKNQLIYPLLFLPLVENAFKYTGGLYQMNIEALLGDCDMLMFSVRNTVPDKKMISAKASGIGLDNLARRLDLLYPGMHRFKAAEENGLFIAEIEINLSNEK